MPALTPFKCRVCGCTADSPCVFGDDDTCAWFDKDRTLCTNLDCIAQVPLGELEEMEAVWLSHPQG